MVRRDLRTTAVCSLLRSVIEKFKNELKGFAKSKGPSNSPPTSHYRLPLLRKW